MNVDVSLVQRVDRPQDEVAAFATDPANDVRWLKGVVASQVEGGGPLAVGSRVHRELRAKGHTLPMTFAVTHLDLAEGVTMRSEGDDEVEFHTTFSALDDGGTLVGMHVSGHTRDGMIGYALGREIEKGVAASLRNLIDVLEGATRGG